MDRKNQYAEVILSLESLELDHPFDYRIPHDMADAVSLGCLVLVPFQSRLATGYVVRVKTNTAIDQNQLKNIQQVVSGAPVFSRHTLNLIYWMSFYYVQPLGSVIKLFVPPGGNIRTEKIWVWRQKKEYDLPLPLSDKQIQKNPELRERLQTLKKEGVVKTAYRLLKPRAALKYEQVVRLNPQMASAVDGPMIPKKAYAQKKIVDFVHNKGPCLQKEVLHQTKTSRGSLQSLLDKKILLTSKKRIERGFQYDYDGPKQKKLTPTHAQKICLQKISEGLSSQKFCAFLIEGVAGSGKTKVYMDICRKVMQKGKRALVLTPEISLTPQLYSRFYQQFHQDVCVYHSNMGTAERYERWLGIAENRYQVVIGTRSAVFSPLKDLGIIILDEEHDPSYKENAKVRYNTGDVALRLAKILDIPVVFGSATPSVSLKYKAETQQHFQLLKMPQKATDCPGIKKEAVHLGGLDTFKQSPIISNRLHAAIQEEIDKKNKVIIFLNKRGYSHFVICGSCGNVPKCSACNLSFTYHIGPNMLRCHHCGRESAFSKTCKKCGQAHILLKGTGIQRVEKQLNMRFQVPVIRMDSDTTVKKKSHQNILNRFMSLSPSILLGTQMIAKGLDIGDVTLVGIINSDSMLELPDYHMYERTYQLICQVAGRAGRQNKPGRVLVQTYNPKHAVIQCFLEGNYQKFYHQELQNRKELSYPPYTNIINIIVSGIHEENVKKDCHTLFGHLQKITKSGDRLLGPAPCPFYRINRYYRWHVIIKTKTVYRILARLKKTIKNFGKQEQNKVIIDVDPSWIL